MKKYALIPAYEPDERLLSLCAELTKEGYETVVVDDGSGEVFRKFSPNSDRRQSF